MYVFSLKRVFAVLVISIAAFTVKAQQVHFVYLQTENGQPFYVKLNRKVVSSSSVGYLILSNLKDGDYQLAIGFPKNEYPEENFRLTIDKKNEGFLLKNFGEKGWGLFNMQSLALLPGTSSNNIVVSNTKTQDDPFSKMLADVVKDSSLLQNNEPVVALKDASSPKKETVIALSDTLQQKESVNDTSAHANNESSSVPVAVSPISKILGKNDKEGMQMVYVDKNDNNDTVRVFIPSEKNQDNNKEGDKKAMEGNNNTNEPSHFDSSQLTITPTYVKIESDTITLVNDTIRIYKETPQKNPGENKDSSTIKQVAPSPVLISAPEQKGNTNENKDAVSGKEELPVVVEPEINNKKTKQNKDNEIIVLPKTVTSSVVNSDCKAFATDSDFLKLRKKMAAEINNEAMIQAAKKVFRTRCFSTEQIKNLSFLFLTDEGKYMFFDAAYAFTSDSDQYTGLESQLTDEYYINRFRAMIHK